jgi:phosphoribosylformylglycinamidine cyclo-ligase
MTTYEDRGVSPDKVGVRRAVSGTSRTLFPGAFCQALPDLLTGSSEHCLLVHADGAGTKSSLAYLWWKETGDIGVFRNIAQDCLVMNLDDLICVGATGPFIFTNVINRDAKRIPDTVISEIVEGYVDLCDRLGRFGVHIELCGGETADVGDLVTTIAADAMMATRVKRSDFIQIDDVAPGLDIIGLSSAGQAPWETAHTTGIGSNGFTAARHEILGAQYRDKYPETFSSDLGDLAYAGMHSLTDTLPGTEVPIGLALLSPTRTYSPAVLNLMSEFRPAIRGLVHNTGGGLAKCLNFGHNVRYVKDSLFTLPPIFEFLRSDIGIPAGELVRVFNLGHRMEVICVPEASSAICDLIRESGIDAQVIGHTEACDQGVELEVHLGDEVISMTSQAL